MLFSKSAEDFIKLLRHTYKGCPTTELLEFAGPHIRTGRPQSPQDVLEGVIHIPLVFYLDCLSFRGSEKEAKLPMTELCTVSTLTTKHLMD